MRSKEQIFLVFIIYTSFSFQVRAFLQEPMQGVVLQTYGAGNAPNNRDDLIVEIKKASERGVIIVNCTQCIHGSVVDAYATGRVCCTSIDISH